LLGPFEQRSRAVEAEGNWLECQLLVRKQPPFLKELQIKDLRVGDASVDLLLSAPPVFRGSHRAPLRRQRRHHQHQVRVMKPGLQSRNRASSQ
jgi:hypothetical protein